MVDMLRVRCVMVKVLCVLSQEAKGKGTDQCIFAEGGRRHIDASSAAQTRTKR